MNGKYFQMCGSSYLSPPVDVGEGVEHLRGDLCDHLLRVGGALGEVRQHVRPGQRVELEHRHLGGLEGVEQGHLFEKGKKTILIDVSFLIKP